MIVAHVSWVLLSRLQFEPAPFCTAGSDYAGNPPGGARFRHDSGRRWGGLRGSDVDNSISVIDARSVPLYGRLLASASAVDSQLVAKKAIRNRLARSALVAALVHQPRMHRGNVLNSSAVC